MKFIRNFGFGILMTLLSPIFLLIFAVTFLFGIFLYIINEPLNIFYFVFGYRRIYQDKYQMELESRKQSETNLHANDPKSTEFGNRPPQVDLALLQEVVSENGDEINE